LKTLKTIVTSEKPIRGNKLKILAFVEATTVNAVAKNMLEFHRAASELTKNQAETLTAEIVLATFVRSSSKDAPPSEFVNAARDLGLDISIIPERFRFDTRVLPTLREVVLGQSPDIVITHQVKSHLLMKLSGLAKQYPWVAFHHGYTTTDTKMRAYNLLNRWSLPAADGVVTVCEAFARDLSDAGVSPGRIHVQHNSIRLEPKRNPEEARTLRQQLGIAGEDKLVLTVGRLSREKAQIDLVVAFNQLANNHPEMKPKLVIVGDGPERGPLAAAAASLGLSEQVVFTGEVRDVQTYYDAADVFVLPSHSEGSPYVLLEAMAWKVPIVATTVGGVPEMVTDEVTALLVPSRDSTAMAVAMARVLTEQPLAPLLTANAYTAVSTLYSPETQARALVELYSSIVRDKARVK